MGSAVRTRGELSRVFVHRFVSSTRNNMNTKRQVEAVYPLSPLQQGMLYHTLRSPDARFYITQRVYTTIGNIDPAYFKRAIESIVDRHAVLITAFDWHGTAM